MPKRLTTADVVSPLTGSPRVEFVQEIQRDRLVVLWQKSLGIDISTCLDGIEGISLHRCRDTGLLFFRPAAVAGTALLYEQLQAFSWYYTQGKWEHGAALDLLPQTGSVLEIGCGDGIFLDACASRGIVVTGLELSPAAASAARGRGHEVMVGTVEELAGGYAEVFDAVCAFQVLEHLAEPGLFLRQVMQMLKPGGHLILAVPNRDSFLSEANRDLAIALDLPPHHMSRWNVDCFRRLGAWYPLRLVTAAFEPLAREHVGQWVESKAKWMKRTVGPCGVLIANGLTKRLAKACYSTKLRHMARGQSLMVVLQKTTRFTGSG